MRKRFKNTVLEGLHIEKAVAEGKCIARLEDRVIFVERVAPGDIADVKLIRKKKNFYEGVPQKIIKPSAHRTEPFCAHFGTCGGCKWQHVAYEEQLVFKRQQVIDNLERIGKVKFPEVQPTLAAPETQYYRNKLEFTFSNRRWIEAEEIEAGEVVDRQGLGFHKPRQFDKVVNVKHCYLQAEPSNEIRNWLREYALQHQLSFYDIRRKEGLMRNLIIRSTSGEDLMVIVQFGQDSKAIKPLMEAMHQQFPQISSLHYVINQKGNETFHDLDVRCVYGDPFISEQLGHLKFRIGPKSFFQTNSAQGTRLYQLVREFADLKGHEVVYDLYCGTGTIGLFLADQCKQVVGVEQTPEAVEDAWVNAKINNIENAHFLAGDSKDLFKESFKTRFGACDVLVTDPPRVGMHADVIEELLELKPAKIIYVSCNPATQARDLQLLDEVYKVTRVAPVDMFPHTHHVENVVLLELRN